MRVGRALFRPRLLYPTRAYDKRHFEWCLPLRHHLFRRHLRDGRVLCIEVFLKALILDLAMVYIWEWLDSFLLHLPKLLHVDFSIIAHQLFLHQLELAPLRPFLSRHLRSLNYGFPCWLKLHDLASRDRLDLRNRGLKLPHVGI